MNRNRLRLASVGIYAVKNPYADGKVASFVPEPSATHGLIVQAATLGGDYCPCCDVGALGPGQHFAHCALTRAKL